MRAVFDTNVLVSAQFWHGPPNRLFNYVRDGDVTIILSPALLTEFADVIGRPKFSFVLKRTGRTPADVLADINQLADVIEPPALAVPVCRDPDDDEILALAVAGKADVIVSGDQDLLTLGMFQAIRILSPAQLLDRLIL